MIIPLETPRLIIRDWFPEVDAPQAFEIYGDPEVTRFIGGQVEASIETQLKSLQRVRDRNAKLVDGSGFWAMVEKETQYLIGAVMLKPIPDNTGKATSKYEIGWHLRKASWGKGYATEAAQAVIEYGFKVLKKPVLYTFVDRENLASIRVVQRLGMIPMGCTNRYYGKETEMFKLEAD